jgi:hypothetical protein
MLTPKNPLWITYSEIFNGPVTLCEDEGVLWFCFRDGQGRWHKEEPATPAMIQAFESGDSVEQAVKWEPPEPLPSSITCPKCGMTSYHPKDIEEQYCGNCHQWHAEMTGTLR